MNANIALLVLVAPTIFNDDAHAATNVPLSVCELLENRLKYDGKVVEVRGTIEGSPEGAALIGQHCRGSIITKGFTWPNAVALAYHTGINSPHKVDFVRDQTQIDRIYRQAKRIRRKYPHAKIVYTYVGLLETFTNPDEAVGVGWSGEILPRGFGHMNACPAQLVIKTIKNLHLQTTK